MSITQIEFIKLIPVGQQLRVKDIADITRTEYNCARSRCNRYVSEGYITSEATGRITNAGKVIKRYMITNLNKKRLIKQINNYGSLRPNALKIQKKPPAKEVLNITLFNLVLNA